MFRITAFLFKKDSQKLVTAYLPQGMLDLLCVLCFSLRMLDLL